MGITNGLLETPNNSFRGIVWKEGTHRDHALRSFGYHGSRVVSHPSLTFSNEELSPEGATYTRSLQSTIKSMDAKVPMVLIENGSALNVCPFRNTLRVGLDMETIIPSLLTVKAYDNTSRKVMRNLMLARLSRSIQLWSFM